jgi:hypothetical protein
MRYRKNSTTLPFEFACSIGAPEKVRRSLDVGNFLDSAIAPLVKHGIVDQDLACDLFYYPVVMCWDTLAPFIASSRSMLGYRLWEDFEFLTLLCKKFRVRFPHGTYPRGATALPLPESWPEAAQCLGFAQADEPGEKYRA